METVKNLVEISKEDRALIAASEKFIDSFGIKEIKNQEVYDTSARILTDIKTRIYDIEKKRVEIAKPIQDGLKALNDFFKRPIERLQGLETTLKRIMGDYIRRKELEAAEKQRAADEIARKEREKAEKEAAKAREKADREFAKGNESAAAAALEKADLKEAQAAAVAPVIAPEINKSGLSLVDNWKAEVIDKKRFLAWAVEKEALEYILIDEKLLNKEAKATKGSRQWPGVKITKSQIEKMRIG